MKIGILTRRFGYNMGSSLQSFAIAELIRGLGHEVEVINYDESSAHWKWKIRPVVENFEYHLRQLLPKEKFEYLEHRHNQIACFENFEKSFLPLSKECVSSSKQLEYISDRYDKIVVGSDQIWSPFLFDSNYFGGFLHENCRDKIIPYAPSLGTSNIEYITERQKTLLKSLTHLSCREYEGAEIIKEITDRDVTVVLDPTLMLSSQTWYDLANSCKVEGIPHRYCLTYFLGNSTNNDVIHHKSKEIGLEVVNVSMFNRPNDTIANFDVKNIGPAEFLSLFLNAEHVFTDSFHATVFSWIFNRDFTVFERFKSTDTINQNSRIHTLLKILGKEVNLYGAQDKYPGLPTIEEKKKISKEYLECCISESV